MGADNSANTCRRITETVRDAGINGITLPRDEVVILTINRQKALLQIVGGDKLIIPFC